jgi:hypothetical protein
MKSTTPRAALALVQLCTPSRSRMLLAHPAAISPPPNNTPDGLATASPPERDNEHDRDGDIGDGTVDGSGEPCAHGPAWLDEHVTAERSERAAAISRGGGGLTCRPTLWPANSCPLTPPVPNSAPATRNGGGDDSSGPSLWTSVDLPAAAVLRSMRRMGRAEPFLSSEDDVEHDRDAHHDHR